MEESPIPGFEELFGEAGFIAVLPPVEIMAITNIFHPTKEAWLAAGYDFMRDRIIEQAQENPLKVGLTTLALTWQVIQTKVLIECQVKMIEIICLDLPGGKKT